jgi:predicted alpha/beta-hydrolase family hydrolase
MKATASRFLISDNIGHVSVLTLLPENVKAFIVLAHGAGAGMTHPFMEKLSQKLFSYSIATIRYNFPYMEKKNKMPDVPAVAEKTVGSILAQVTEKYKKLPVFLAGKSFGGRMSSQFASKNDVNAMGIIFYGFPLHAPGKADIQRAEHLKNVKVPLLFLQGTKDALAKLELIEKVCKQLPSSTLVTFAGADHSFKVKGKEVIDELADATLQWIEKTV